MNLLEVFWKRSLETSIKVWGEWKISTIFFFKNSSKIAWPSHYKFDRRKYSPLKCKYQTHLSLAKQRHTQPSLRAERFWKLNRTGKKSLAGNQIFHILKVLIYNLYYAFPNTQEAWTDQKVSATFILCDTKCEIKKEDGLKRQQTLTLLYYWISQSLRILFI